MNISIKYNILLTILTALTGASCWGAAWFTKDNPYNTLLLEAAKEGNMAQLIMSLDKGSADIDVINKKNGDTPLIISIINGHIHIALELLTRGADVNKGDKEGCAPLLCAIRKEDNMILVDNLLANKADSNAINKYGETVLMEIARKSALEPQYRHQEMVSKIIKAKAEVNFHSRKNDPVLFWAIKGGLEEYIIQLINAGASINFSGLGGHLPLSMAASLGHKAIASRLIAAGADIYAAIPILVRKDDKEGVRLLMSLEQALQADLAQVHDGTRENDHDEARPMYEGEAPPAYEELSFTNLTL